MISNVITGKTIFCTSLLLIEGFSILVFAHLSFPLSHLEKESSSFNPKAGNVCRDIQMCPRAFYKIVALKGIELVLELY